MRVCQRGSIVRVVSGPATHRRAVSRALDVWAAAGTAFVLTGLFVSLVATVAVPVFAVVFMGSSPAALLLVPIGGFFIWFYASALLGR